MAAVSKVLVVGGGVGGLTAATALGQRGIAVELVELQASWTVYGVGIIQPNNTLRAMDRIGLARACADAGAPFAGWQIFDKAGRLLAEEPAPTTAAPEFPAVNGITRPQLHQILVDAAVNAGVTASLGVTVETLEQDADSVDVVFTDGRRGRYDLVIAADGVNSVMRRRLFGEAYEPKFTGQGVWRYNLPRPAGMAFGGIYFGHASKVGLVPLSPALMYMFLVTAEPDNPWRDGAGLADAMRERLAEYSGHLGDLAKLITDPAGVVYKPMQNVMLPAPWHRGRVVVIGDAAHATTPHLAQGAAMAIEDAVLLGELMARDDALEPLLAEFMARRFERAKYVVETSSALADWELEAWAGRPDPNLDPGRLLHEATVELMKAY